MPEPAAPDLAARFTPERIAGAHHARVDDGRGRRGRRSAPALAAAAVVALVALVVPRLGTVVRRRRRRAAARRPDTAGRPAGPRAAGARRHRLRRGEPAGSRHRLRRLAHGRRRRGCCRRHPGRGRHGASAGRPTSSSGSPGAPARPRRRVPAAGLPRLPRRDRGGAPDAAFEGDAGLPRRRAREPRRRHARPTPLSIWVAAIEDCSILSITSDASAGSPGGHVPRECARVHACGRICAHHDRRPQRDRDRLGPGRLHGRPLRGAGQPRAPRAQGARGRRPADADDRRRELSRASPTASWAPS